ncbi:MAG: ATP synthase F1 subunit gamma [Nitrososphaeria archaeon]
MNLRQVRKKIKTIVNVRKITKAMERVAAVKMKKSQKIALEGKPYQEALTAVIDRIIDPHFPLTSPFFKRDQPEKKQQDLYIFISSNKGLCGAFNFNLFKLAMKEIDFSKSSFIVLGKKGGLFLSKLGAKIIADFSEQLPFEENVSPIFSLIEQQFFNGWCNQVFLFYNKFISSFRTQPVKELLLPLTGWKEKRKQETKGSYLIEPSPKKVLNHLIVDYLQYRIRRAILDSEASEHSARMLAMKNASDNADEIVYNLTLLRNKLRQQIITYELLDMVTAKEATEGET